MSDGADAGDDVALEQHLDNVEAGVVVASEGLFEGVAVVDEEAAVGGQGEAGEVLVEADVVDVWGSGGRGRGGGGDGGGEGCHGGEIRVRVWRGREGFEHGIWIEGSLRRKRRRMGETSGISCF